MILKEKLREPLKEEFVKVVVDIERNILAYGEELHLDCADELVSDGSDRNNLWGANIYPENKDIQFVSMINMRPQSGNNSMEIKLGDVKEKVRKIIHSLMFS